MLSIFHNIYCRKSIEFLMLVHKSYGKQLIGKAIVSKYDDIIHIDYLMIYPKYRKNGYGKELLNHIETSTKIYKPKRINLTVFDSIENNLTDFYKHQGYKIDLNKKQHVYDDGETIYDTIPMYKIPQFNIIPKQIPDCNPISIFEMD